MLLKPGQHKRYYTFTAVSFLVAGVLFLLPRMLDGNNGPSPVFGIFMLLCAAYSFRKSSRD